nr:MAG TPA: hypothetical protein [Caudoviricetes sp.]
MVYNEIYTKHDTKTIVMEETNRQSLYVCFAAHNEWHCRLDEISLSFT